MSTKTKFQAIKGTRDLLPPETALWNRVEQAAHDVFGTYGYGEIRLPYFGPTELVARAVGGETDIVSKEMYSFDDRDETSISLRPEATASVCRAYIEQGMQQLPQPVKLYYTGPMFRRERPQKGRYRQFYQIGAEVRSEEHTSELQSPCNLVCRLLLEKKKKDTRPRYQYFFTQQTGSSPSVPHVH